MKAGSFCLSESFPFDSGAWLLIRMTYNPGLHPTPRKVSFMFVRMEGPMEGSLSVLDLFVSLKVPSPDSPPLYTPLVNLDSHPVGC